MAVTTVQLGNVGATPIIVGTLPDSFITRPGAPAMTQITLSANYARYDAANWPPSIGGFPRVTTRRPAIDDVASAHGGTVPNGSTCWSFTLEAAALIAASAATATGATA